MAALSRRELFGLLSGSAFLVPGFAQTQSPPQVGRPISRSEKLAFLKTAKVIRQRSAPGGITETLRLTLSDGLLTHDASFQSIDESRTHFESIQGTELNFRDSWKFNLAAFRLDEILGLNMIPVTVERHYNGKPGSFTWWVDDALMTELNRYKKKIAPPDMPRWTQQMQIVRVFDQLIYNTDRNMGNIVIDERWNIWMIDHTRAFRMRTDLLDPKVLTRCDRGLLEGMKRLDIEILRDLKTYLNSAEIQAVLKRREKIVETIEKWGPTALYTSEPRPA